LKRERDDDEGGTKKKLRTATSSKTLGGLSTKELKAIIVAGNLGKYTVPELKELLTAKGLSISGKKADLVERVEQWVENN
jgi:ATP-dependent DNA helicase 2 subunit 1